MHVSSYSGHCHGLSLLGGSRVQMDHSKMFNTPCRMPITDVNWNEMDFELRVVDYTKCMTPRYHLLPVRRLINPLNNQLECKKTSGEFKGGGEPASALSSSDARLSIRNGINIDMNFSNYKF